VSSGPIASCFAGLRARREAALIPFLMAGDPDLGTTRQMLLAAERAGADLIELGVPFSDPTADGPILQRSAARALANGTSLGRILAMISELRGELKVPLVLFGYYNPIFHYGPERLAADAKKAGVNGLLVVDLPPEEADELRKPARAQGLDLIFLLAPTSDQERVRAVLRKASGFLYFVSMTGITGSKPIDTSDVRRMVEGLRARCKLPIGVGFGIRNAENAGEVAEFADAVIVGSALMSVVEEHRDDAGLVERVFEFIRGLKEATRRRGSAAA
jgi:tryptophan synthase alpha chain